MPERLSVKHYFTLLLMVVVWPIVETVAFAQGAAFTYQGRLTDAGNPADGLFDMQFKLFDTPTVGTGTQQGSTITNPTVQVSAANFSVTLDFGSNVFDGTARYLEIEVRPAGNPNPHTILSPRQPITSTPYAIHSLTAANAMQLSGMNPTSFVQFNGSGNVGVGTSMPLHRLAISGGPAWTTDGWGGAVELGNAAAIGWRANSSGTRFGIGRTNAGMFFFHTNSELGASTNGPVYSFKMDNSGSIGIGDIGINTDLSGAKLSLFTSTLGFGYGLAHTNGTVTVGSYVDSTGGWLGTRSNHPLHFFTNDGLPKMTLDTSSNQSNAE